MVTYWAALGIGIQADFLVVIGRQMFEDVSGRRSESGGIAY